MTISIDGYEVDIIVSGFPGKSVCHGSLGWSTIVLLRGHGRVALVDVGTFGVRNLLRNALADRGLGTEDVTDILLTHAHHDHCINWVMFRDARIVLGQSEIEWAVAQPWGETPVAELYVDRLNDWPTLHRADDREEILPGITCHVAPGHTPGHLVYVLRGKERDVILTGDAAKNRAELISRTTDMTYDASVSRASLDMIWEFWRRQPNSVVVPGHDLPMVLKNGKPEFMSKREAAISAWYGEDLETTTRIELTVD